MPLPVHVWGYQHRNSLHQLRCLQGQNSALPFILDTSENIKSHFKVLDLLMAFSGLSQTAHSPKWEVWITWPASPYCRHRGTWCGLGNYVHECWLQAGEWERWQRSCKHHPGTCFSVSALLQLDLLWKQTQNIPKSLCSALSLPLGKRRGEGQHKVETRKVWCSARAHWEAAMIKAICELLEAWGWGRQKILDC